jgi:serine/threonine protein kinase/formylglycine-generating enzyme required for sulfatase activity
MSTSKSQSEGLNQHLASRLQQVVDRFEDAWQSGQRPQIDDFLPPEGPDRCTLLVELAHVDLERRLKGGEAAQVEQFLKRYPELAVDPAVVLKLLAAEFALRRRSEPELSWEEYRQRLSPLGEKFLAYFDAEKVAHPAKASEWKAGAPRIDEHLGSAPEPERRPRDPTVITNRESPPRNEAEPRETKQPACLGRYRVMAELGHGSFGVVYKAYDDELRRDVAIKLPHRHSMSALGDIETYLAEGRILAELDHPNIVPVYDLGRTEDGLPFIVSRFIDGVDLASRLRQSRLSLREAVEIVATVAEALHHAHKQGFVHRDVKPGNILLEKSGRPFVADFGLALREQDVRRGFRYAGTPAYMSPEQARSEGLRVDGRSDVFSLGIVFYELLTGRRPFSSGSREDLVEQITTAEPRPPRQLDDRIPKELERICLHALAKRAAERYSTARDMADDLRSFLADASLEEKPVAADRPKSAEAADTPLPGPVTPFDQQAIMIVPKGLRSFDAADADFFLELLPGPRDRAGLPQSIRFWKSRVEWTDPDSTFAVGLIYGPSGCGKSSFVKAGLLPRLAPSVKAVYVEAMARETETRLLKRLRRVANLTGDLNLVESLGALRKGRFLGSGQKVLLVLDQFEQWLHARRSDESSELVSALRQCDGEHVQCIILVRGDFWVAVNRFMNELEIELHEGQNMALVDLFDLRHARKVLMACGRAFSALPEMDTRVTKDQTGFLDQAIAGLAQNGKIISVRLALFAEMVKGKSWTPATLKEIGGIEGVGMTFLEETFAASTAPPQHRLHQKAAQEVLKALLPEARTEIKGQLRSRQELLEASGYGNRPRDFDATLRILDSELRLITPTDPEGGSPEGGLAQTGDGERYYQLTHDYLVPSLRSWLTRKQKETRRGRAELRLAERAALWIAKPENRHLPAWWEWANILLFTPKREWTTAQQKMMTNATRYHAVRGVLVTILAVSTAFWGLEMYRQQANSTANKWLDRLIDARIEQVPGIIAEMEGHRPWVRPKLTEILNASSSTQDAKVRASLAMLSMDASQVENLYQRLLKAQPAELLIIRDALLPHHRQLLERFWAVVEEPATVKELQRLRAAAALAMYEPESERWTKVLPAVAKDLVTVPLGDLGGWRECFLPVRAKMLTPLAAIFRDCRNENTARSAATTDTLAEYAADQPQVLADLLLDADENQFAGLYPRLNQRGNESLPILTGEINRKLPPDLPSSDGQRENLAKRQVNAAVAMLRLNQQEKVWPLLKRTPPDDPRTRSYLIHRLKPLGAAAGAIIKRLEEEPDLSVRRALLLSLGEFGEKEPPPEIRLTLLTKLEETYRTHSDPGLHAAAEWLLRTWKQETWLKQLNDRWASDKQRREQELQRIKNQLAKDREKTPPQWYVNGQGQTMVVLPGPVDFVMGSPETESGRSNESQHRKRIGRTFALAAKPVTVDEYRRFDPQFPDIKKWAPTDDCPVMGMRWFQAAAYCNWLSKQEGLPESEWCYEPLRDPKGAMKLARNYLQRTGYRLPTEAEMEYATRAGAATSRYFGEADDLLPKYAWYLKNSEDRSWPVGSLKPNDFGLFDMLGNVYVWCQDWYRDYPTKKGEEPSEDTEEDVLEISLNTNRVVRGGSYHMPPSRVRSADRNVYWPVVTTAGVGFRPARTLAP